MKKVIEISEKECVATCEEAFQEDVLKINFQPLSKIAEELVGKKVDEVIYHTPLGDWTFSRKR